MARQVTYAVGNLDTFVIGTTKPVIGLYGLSSGIGPTPTTWIAGPTPDATGSIVLTTPNQVFTNVKFTGYVKNRTSGTRFNNCWFNGSDSSHRPNATSNTALLDCNHTASSDVIVTRSLFEPQDPNVAIDAIIGHDYKVYRSYAHWVVDGFGVYNNFNSNGPCNVGIYGNLVEDLFYYSPDPNHGDQRTHNDCIQIQGNSLIDIKGNTLLGRCSSTVGNAFPGASPAPVATDPYYPAVTGQAIGFTPAVGTISLVTVDQNWLDYGAQSITAAVAGKPIAANMGSLTNNRFGRNQPTKTISTDPTSRKREILVEAGLNFTESGNIHEDDSSPVTAYRGI